MADSFDISGDWVRRVLFAVTVGGLFLVVVLPALQVGGLVGVAVAVLLSMLATVVAVGVWLSLTGRAVGPVMGTPWDITDDPYAFPGQRAKERWLRAVQRLPDGEEEED
ncbi:hypothetical protein [Haloarchaeobius salinus]|uniref:hypothetical protein n=1 Tax=Haloarchaeobius salinus TaxID=1198298 RepID=UPI0021098AD9|nr:hypothetical protein [Haloarchaeobius salinus]